MIQVVVGRLWVMVVVLMCNVREVSVKGVEGGEWLLQEVSWRRIVRRWWVVVLLGVWFLLWGADRGSVT